MRPIGPWSTCTTLSRCWMPVIRVCRPGTVRAPLSSRASALYKMSLTSVDLPDPDTPVTATRQPSGNATSTPRRLCSAAPLTATSRLRVPLPAALGGPGWTRARTGRRRSATRGWPGVPRPCRRPRCGRRARRRGGRCRRSSRPPGSCPRHARRRSACCPGCAAAAASRAAGGCPAGAARSTARRGRTAPRPGRSRSGWPAGSAGPPRRPAWPTPGPGSGSPARRRGGSPSWR